jgi:hypothetical protein
VRTADIKYTTSMTRGMVYASQMHEPSSDALFDFDFEKGGMSAGRLQIPTSVIIFTYALFRFEQTRSAGSHVCGNVGIQTLCRCDEMNILYWCRRVQPS